MNFADIMSTTLFKYIFYFISPFRLYSRVRTSSWCSANNLVPHCWLGTMFVSFGTRVGFLRVVAGHSCSFKGVAVHSSNNFVLLCWLGLMFVSFRIHVELLGLFVGYSWSLVGISVHSLNSLVSLCWFRLMFVSFGALTFEWFEMFWGFLWALLDFQKLF